jgi:hypothetical protein
MSTNVGTCSLTLSVTHAMAVITYAVETSIAVPAIREVVSSALPLRGCRMVLH